MATAFSSRFRSNELELMDGADFDRAEYAQTLKQLESINRLTNGYGPTISAIAHVARANPKRPLRVLDIGFGHGDTLRRLRRWSKEKSIELDLIGVDLNPLSSELAENATPKTDNITYLTCDIFDFNVKDVDVMINSLFMHHLSDHQIVRLLRWMTENAQLAWFINDLHRNALAYHFIRYATQVGRMNRLIRNDAPVSVARSFRDADWKGYAAEAGIPADAMCIRWHWAFRYGVFCDTPQAREGMKR